MDMLDADYNGVLEPKEVAERPALVARWLQLDRDGNDRLDPAELERW